MALSAVQIQVQTASQMRMQHFAPTACQLTSEFLVQRAEPLTNTFLNFADKDDVEVLKSSMRRSRSAGLLSRVDALLGEDCCSDCSSPTCCMSDEYGADDIASCSTHASTSSFRSDLSVESASFGGMDGLAMQIFQRLQMNNSEGSEDQAQEDVSEQPVEQEEEADSEPKTTIMIQNLPRVFAQQTLLDAMDTSGFTGLYDFCYMPVAFSNGGCRGYAFVNFKQSNDAKAFMEQWQGSRQFCEKRHKKALLITWAAEQGLDALLAQPSMKKLQRVRTAGFRPFIAGQETKDESS